MRSKSAPTPHPGAPERRATTTSLVRRQWEDYVQIDAGTLSKVEALKLTAPTRSKVLIVASRMQRAFDVERMGFGEWREFPQKYFIEVCGGRQSATDVVKILKRSGILECDESYDVGRYCKSYRFAPRLLSNRSVRTRLKLKRARDDGPILRKALKDLHELKFDHNGALREIASTLQPKVLENLKVDEQIEAEVFQVVRLPEGREYMANKNKALSTKNHWRHYVQFEDGGKVYEVGNVDKLAQARLEVLRRCYTRMCDAWRDKILYAAMNRTNGRLDSNLTNTWTPLRKFLSAGGEKLHSFDIRNSQFAFLAHILAADDPAKASMGEVKDAETIKLIRDISEEEDVRLFVENAREGTLYETMMEKIGVARKETVKRMMFEIFFSSMNFMSKTKKKVMELFPSLYELIKHHNKTKGDKTFPIFLQKVESKMMIGEVLRRTQEEKIKAWTIHDSILVKESEKERERKLIKEVFNENGFICRMKEKTA